MPIKESRYITIDTKIISRADVLKLAKVIISIYKRKKDKPFTSISFSVDCGEDTKFTSEDLDIFSDDSPITTKRVEEIKLLYRSSSEERIEIILRHNALSTPATHSYYKSSINVEGDNSNWVNGTLKKFEEIVDGFEPQNTFVTKYRIYLFWPISLIIAWFVWFRIKYFFDEYSSETGGIGLNVAFPILLGMSLALMVIMYLINSVIIKLLLALENLYPNVELQIGPEHKLKEKRNRLLVYIGLTVVVIPIVIQILFEVVKSLVTSDVKLKMS